jgi:hypothetical protein
MIIANPIYDTVFKYLMEDADIAKGLLSMILNVEIMELTVKPQETTSEMPLSESRNLSIYRLDFIAIIKEENGNFKKALIELQKSKRSTNIVRFRRYLGENYHREDVTIVNGVEVLQPLEIVTIYFLGFELDDVDTPVMKVKNSFIDVTTGLPLSNEPLDKFIRLLNHESYTIQIPKLQVGDQSRIENVLSVFSQRYKLTDDRKLDYQGMENDPLKIKIINRLTRAIADDNLRRKMDLEDEFERGFMMELEEKLSAKELEIKKREQQIKQQNQEIKQQNQEIEQQNQEIEQQNQEIEQQNQEIELNKQELEQKEQKLEQNKQELNEKDKIIEALMKQINDLK